MERLYLTKSHFWNNIKDRQAVVLQAPDNKEKGEIRDGREKAC